jgi:hypothetical protein
VAGLLGLAMVRKRDFLPAPGVQPEAVGAGA